MCVAVLQSANAGRCTLERKYWVRVHFDLCKCLELTNVVFVCKQKTAKYSTVLAIREAFTYVDLTVLHLVRV